LFTLFLSAFLLFWIQPLFGKMALPLLGGSPGVWNTAMLFFQLTLLVGYTYVHILCKHISITVQPYVHIFVLCLAITFLPIEVASTPEGTEIPLVWLLGMLVTSIGLPFFAVSTSAPLLQRWFSLSDHVEAKSPYFLYAASNLGSLAALICYPVFFEPLFRLTQQGRLWAAGYGLLIALTTLCAIMLRSNSITAVEQQRGLEKYAGITSRQRFMWIALSFAPSSLLLGVTAHITTDVAAVPLLWVIPLALYLLTFVIAFARKPLLSHSFLSKTQLATLFGAFILLPHIDSTMTIILIHLALFFVLAQVCHSELVRIKPGVDHLTEFYFFIALGGALGGVFNTLLAPLIFNGIYEYGLAIIIACLLRPGILSLDKKERVEDFVIPLGILAIIVIPDYLFGGNPMHSYTALFLTYQIVLAALIYRFRESAIRFGLSIGAVLVGAALLVSHENLVAQERSFFGVYRVLSIDTGKAHYFVHGTTLHGIQLRSEAEQKEPQGYYARSGALGQFFSILDSNHLSVSDIGLVGLGAGATLCYMRPDQDWVIYEIDPVVARIAQDQHLFTYWSKCAESTSTSLVLGDARLSLEKESDGRYDLLIMDAYSSDAIPIHLLTKQSMHLYRSKINSSGFLLFHVSNNHLDLPRVLAALLADANLDGRINYGKKAIWVVVAADQNNLELFSAHPNWQPLPQSSVRNVWTDDFSNILNVLK
jgi:hypothetical protein